MIFFCMECTGVCKSYTLIFIWIAHSMLPLKLFIITKTLIRFKGWKLDNFHTRQTGE